MSSSQPYFVISSNRSFYVILDEKLSHEYAVNIGVTQGCILAPALQLQIDYLDDIVLNVSVYY